MRITDKNLTIDPVGAAAVTALWSGLALACAADQFTTPFIGMDQVTRNGP